MEPLPMSTRRARSFCRTCGGLCGVVLALDASDRLVDVRGDHEHPMTQGYACSKGIAGPQLHNSPARLLQPLKRQADGTFAEIPLAQALDEIAARMAELTTRHGPRSHAIYTGTQAATNAPDLAMFHAWKKATQCLHFSSATIDQSAKWLTMDRLGVWAAGPQRFEQSDVWMCVGSNPLVSVMGGLNGFTALNPNKRIKAAKARGMKIIVIDPRRTETAHFADVFLQPLPGEDASIAAGMIHLVLREGWEDREFCTRWVNGVEDLRAAVDAYTPEYVSRRAGIGAEDLYRATRLFAYECQRGAAFTGTGPDMATHSNLAEHLIQTLNVICGRFARAGDRVQNPGVMAPRVPQIAQAISPARSFEQGPQSRIRGRGTLMGEMLTGTLADEILTPGEGQIRSLFVIGGNPASAVPETRKIKAALASLDLLVTIEPYRVATAQLAHYILPPLLQYERVDMPIPIYETYFYDEPFSQYARAEAAPPPGSQLINDWHLFWELAHRLELTLEFDGVPLDMTVRPGDDELLRILSRNSQVPFDEIKAHPGGKRFAIEQFVEAASAESSGRFEVAPADIVAEIAAMSSEPVTAGHAAYDGVSYSHRLAVRRAREAINSLGTAFDGMRKRAFNPVNVHPDDCVTLEIAPGEKVLVISPHGRIPAIVQADATLRLGVVTMQHGWGGFVDDAADYDEAGACINLLTSTERDYQKENAMPRQSAIPVNIVRAGTQQG